MTNIVWNDTLKAHLTERWLAGDSAGVIADEMGTTRSAIIGAVHRLKLVREGQPINVRAPSPRKPRDPAGTRNDSNVI